jgi:putative chitinase
MYNLTLAQFSSMLSNIGTSSMWYDIAMKLFPKYNIDTDLRISGFMSQCIYESANFQDLSENLHYSAANLDKNFSKYFGSVRNSSQYANQPEAIANIVYANRMGNGPESSGDGWKFRGRGLIQITGRNNYTAFGKFIGKSPEDAAAYMETPMGAFESACWYWDSNNINSAADARDVKMMTRIINGGYNGLDGRTSLYNKCIGILTQSSTQQPISPSQPINLNQTITMGMKSPEVLLVQQKLGINGDGVYGPNTKKAVMDFQTANGLTSDGILGPNTLRAILK